jgi:hypothetical protein
MITLPTFVRRSLRPALAALTLLAAPASALAQPKGTPPAAAPQSEVNRANALGHEGRAAYEAGRFAEALEKFRAADRIVHSPVLALHVARCERNVGRLVAARSSYRAIVDEPLVEDAPQAFVAARADAERELAALLPKIPTVRPIVPEGAAGELVIDGIAITLSEATSGVAVDPGEHEVIWRSASGSSVTRKIRLDEGAPPLTVDLRASEAAPARPPPPPPRREPQPVRSSGGTLVPGLIVTGIGVAALGVGAVTGLVAMSETSDIESRCDGTSCDPRDADKVDSVRSLAAVSTVGFVAGGILTAGGVVLLIALGPGDAEDAARAPAPRFTVVARPTSGALRLAF